MLLINILDVLVAVQENLLGDREGQELTLLVLGQLRFLGNSTNLKYINVESKR